MTESFADKVIRFNKNLNFTGVLPPGINIMNPFREDEKIIPISSAFYHKFYHDTNSRHLILGINPGRFGGGVTGVPFTDSKRLKNECGIAYTGKETHEPSSVFVYDVIHAYGGPAAFYQKFYINSICPLGFTATGKNGKEVNYNYYDSRELTAAVYDFIIQSIRQQISFGINTNVCFCFGTGKNEKFLRQLNAEQKFFEKIVALEHPRFVMQYKARTKSIYIDKYLAAFHKATL
ncbi:DUF4918 domain-containing protein [Adhaeribacter aerolatus]|uniref:DUF4918 domain-containing protein n=1 Tax=Adhaeribacter aerolatus TaxID=670289 RepID=A0A512B137_9BACT|nr:uracil-DNA glycosylase family protein [Adhaeribacter aerolatus]GEO05662.1 DUF4918 domain-containing protein [Adhaeribacter aerolatus]